ncbi:MAG: folylpolyglutamate synthase/dihydrofolate synthase family protein [Actinomycetes bacterium]
MGVRFASIAEAVGWLDSHIDYERVAPTRRSLPSLKGVTEALRLLGSPQESFEVIHITGTNGKGSTTAMISSLLVEAGLSVGTYTSPNLHTVNERIGRDLVPVSDEVLTDLLYRLAMVEPELGEPLTRFELLTLAALLHFADEAVDVAVVEVGLGGTWDSTNVVDGVVSVITSIGLDHMAVLGNSEIEIATDKAGIIKPGCTAVVGEVTDEIAAVIEARCDDVGAAGMWRGGSTFACTENRLAFGGRLVDLSVPGAVYSEVLVPLNGAHQGRNASVALAAVTAFLGRALSEEVVELGFARAEVPGRCEVLGHLPLVVVDGAHNAAGATALGEALVEGFAVGGPKVALLGMLEGRDPADLLKPLIDAGIERFVCVAPETPRAMAVAEIVTCAERLGARASAAASIESGAQEVLKLAGGEGLVLATGSLYVVGDARRCLQQLIADR